MDGVARRVLYRSTMKTTAALAVAASLVSFMTAKSAVAGLLDDGAVAHRDAVVPASSDDEVDARSDVNIEEIAAAIEIDAPEVPLTNGELAASSDLLGSFVTTANDSRTANALIESVIAFVSPLAIADVAAPSDGVTEVTTLTFEAPRPARIAVVGEVMHVLNDHDIAQSIRADHSDELEYCYTRVPSNAAVTASLHLSIAQSGVVTGVRINGAMPSAVSTCLVSVASHWQFPRSSAAVEIDHSLRLSTIR